MGNVFKASGTLKTLWVRRFGRAYRDHSYEIKSQRLTEVAAHRVVLRHPAYTTLVHPCTAPTAGDKLKLIYDYWQANQTPNEPKLKRDLKLAIRQPI